MTNRAIRILLIDDDDDEVASRQSNLSGAVPPSASGRPKPRGLGARKVSDLLGDLSRQAEKYWQVPLRRGVVRVVIAHGDGHPSFQSVNALVPGRVPTLVENYQSAYGRN